MARSFRLTTHLNIGSRLIEPAFDTLKYGTKDQLLYSALHGTRCSQRQQSPPDC
jgi:hypothetical protein